MEFSNRKITSTAAASCTAAVLSGPWNTLVLPLTGGTNRGEYRTYHDQARWTQHKSRGELIRMEVQIRGPSVSKSVVIVSRARHKCQCTPLSPTREEIPTSVIKARSGRVRSEDYLHHTAVRAQLTSIYGETPDRAKSVWFLITRMVGKRRLIYVLK